MTLAVPKQVGKYTKSDIKIMEFIETFTDEFLFMSIGQLSERLDMSEATISRFARHIGYQDFKDMKSGVLQQKAGAGPARKIAGTLLKEQGFDVKKWFALQQECLEMTQEQTNLQEFSRAVERICEAGRIYIHAKNASTATGQLLFFRLRRLGFDVSVIPSGGSEVIEGIAHAKTGDLVILFSYSKVSEEGKMILDYAKTAGYDTLAFTSLLPGDREQPADLNLYVYRGKKEEYHSMTAAIAMVDALVLAVSEKMESVSAEKLSRIQRMKTYYKRDSF